ncbi:MAG: GtrA family protein [Candidatus Micrarchaeota archaeon]
MKRVMRLIRKKIIPEAAEHKDTFPKFILIGISATLLTLGLLYYFTEWLHVHYLLSGALATQISIIWNFLWHDNWTWGKRKKERSLLSRFAAFEAIYVTSMVANVFLLYVFTDFFGVPYLLSMLVATGITFMFNFGMHEKITFKEAD